MEEGLKKKKKKKRQPNTTAIKKYHQVPVDEKGAPIMPIMLRGLTIHSLGKIVHDRKKFHAKRYIWPVGFKSSRTYCSMTNLNARCEYVSEIIDTETEPRFVVTCNEDPNNPIVIEASTASGAWAQVGKRINDLKEEIIGKRMFTQLSGPEMFGFSHPTIAKLIQELPNAELCDRYVFQEFAPSNTPLPQVGKKGRKSQKKGEDGEGDDETEEEIDEQDEEAEDFDIGDREYESDGEPVSSRAKGDSRRDSDGEFELGKNKEVEHINTAPNWRDHKAENDFHNNNNKNHSATNNSNNNSLNNNTQHITNVDYDQDWEEEEEEGSGMTLPS
jgi:hypothetical protein